MCRHATVVAFLSVLIVCATVRAQEWVEYVGHEYNCNLILEIISEYGGDVFSRQADRTTTLEDFFYDLVWSCSELYASKNLPIPTTKPTSTPTATATPKATATPSVTPTAKATATPTATSTSIATSTSTATFTPTQRKAGFVGVYGDSGTLQFCVMTDSLRVRSSPGGSVVGSLHKGTNFTVDLASKVKSGGYVWAEHDKGWSALYP